MGFLVWQGGNVAVADPKLSSKLQIRRDGFVESRHAFLDVG